jgi:hypothetical protein
MSVTDLADPRMWPGASAADGTAARLHRAAQAAIDAGNEGATSNAETTRLLRQCVASTDGHVIAEAVASAPSHPVARYLWRALAGVEQGERSRTMALRTVLLALPVIVVSALDGRGARLTLSGVVPEPRALETLLRDAREFGGARTFALSPTFVGVAALEPANLPRLLATRSVRDAREGSGLPPLDFAPCPIDVEAGGERVHLRFIMAAVLTAPGADPVCESAIDGWGMAFADALRRQLAAPGLSLLALPRPPQRLVAALQTGRAVQREISAQIFASNAIRGLRASVGEPTAIISAHRAPGAPGGGELRLSLSSPFAPRAAEGFRCPLYPYESVHDVATMLAALLHDCRVLDVQVRAGVHPDIDAVTGGPLLFKDAGTPERPLH